MASFDDLTNQVHLQLLGFVEDQEQLTVITTSFLSTDMSFTVSDVTQVSSGLIEVGDELMWCSRVDVDANIIYVSIRALYGTSQDDHDAGELVRNSPKYPRSSIRKAINDSILSVYPDLFAVNNFTFTFAPAQMSYDLPGDVELVLDVTYDAVGPTREWPHIRRYDVNLNSTTGKTIDLFDSPAPGRTVNVLYRTVPTPLDIVDVTDFAGSGLPQSAELCIVYGACARLVGYLETARLSNTSAESKLLDQVQGAGAATAAARYFYQMHLQTRAEEARRLLDRYPPRIHFVR